MRAHTQTNVLRPTLRLCLHYPSSVYRLTNESIICRVGAGDLSLSQAHTYIISIDRNRLPAIDPFQTLHICTLFLYLSIIYIHTHHHIDDRLFSAPSIVILTFHTLNQSESTLVNMR